MQGDQQQNDGVLGSVGGPEARAGSAFLTSVDLLFALAGTAVPRNHGYSLYGAVSRVVPQIHAPQHRTGIGIFPIGGTSNGNGTILLTDRSVLRIRVPAAQLPLLLPLAGKLLDLNGCTVRVGVPHVQALVPAASLASRFVLIKLARPPGQHDVPPQVTPERFLEAARKKLTELGITDAEPGIQLIRSGCRAGEPRRRVIRVKEQTHVGFAMDVRGLMAEESIRLQEQGLGGRRMMGCGLFLPARG